MSRSLFTYTIFDTPLGRCGIAWSAEGVRSIQLPYRLESQTVAQLRRHAPAAVENHPPVWVRKVIRLLVQHLQGHPMTFDEVQLDLSGITPFRRRVYAALRRVKSGQTVTYGELALLAGAPGSARAVGSAMANNSFPIVVPCHRVLAAGGRFGGFSAYGGTALKKKLLIMEGARLPQRSENPEGESKRRTGPIMSMADPRFDMKKAVHVLRQADPGLARLIDRVGSCGLECAGTEPVFEALAEAIIYQQLTGKAAETILGKFKRLVGGGKFPSPRQVLTVSEERIREAGLSRAKTLALRDLANRVEAGEVPDAEVMQGMSDSELIDCLTKIRGVGRWTVEMLLIFHLGRPDVLSSGDYGIRKGFARAFDRKELSKPAELERRGLRWRPYRSVACWYLWRAAEMKD